MPAGPQLIEAVAKCLATHAFAANYALFPSEIRAQIAMDATNRAIRYAITALIKDGRAKRRGPSGPAYAVVAECVDT
jgi:hypothetical protein